MTQEQMKEVLQQSIANAGIKDKVNQVAEMMFDLYEKGFRDGLDFACQSTLDAVCNGKQAEP